MREGGGARRVFYMGRGTAEGSRWQRDRSGSFLSTQSPPDHPIGDCAAATAISGASPMASLKRKRSIVDPDDGGEIDIASALTGTRTAQLPLDKDSDDEFIHDAIVKRHVKGGTHLLKKINGKGDVGGGSFQSMGRYHTPPSSFLPHTCQVSIRSCSVRSHCRDTALQPQSSAQLSPPSSPPPHATSWAWLARGRERPSRT